MQTTFPVFDLDKFESSGVEEKRALGAEVDRICRATGFLAITNHGVPQAVIDAAWSKARAFFDLPPEEKQRAKAPYQGYPYGYLGPELEALAKSRNVDTPPDLKESFNGGPLQRAARHDRSRRRSPSAMRRTIWPEAPDGFVEAWKAYYAAMEDLAARIMRLFAPRSTCRKIISTAIIDAPISALRALNYPEQTVRAEARPAARRRAHRLRQPDHPAAAGGIAGAWRSHAGRGVDASAADPGRLRHQHRRPDGALDQRPLGLDPAPRRQSRRRRGRHGPAPVAGLLPPAELVRRDRLLDACLAPGEAPKYEPVRSGPYLMSKFKATTK